VGGLRKRLSGLACTFADKELQENELWDKESNHSLGSWVPPQKLQNGGYAPSATASMYGRETYYEPRGASPSPFGGPGATYASPPEYASGRNTPYGAPAVASPFANSPLRAMSDAGSLYAPAPMRPATNYLDMPIPNTTSPEPQSALGGPSDADLERAVQELLRGADLNTVTKRGVRQRLEERFGMDLASRKAAINAAIDRVLLSHAG
jgi:chitin synthase